MSKDKGSHEGMFELPHDQNVTVLKYFDAEIESQHRDRQQKATVACRERFVTILAQVMTAGDQTTPVRKSRSPLDRLRTTL